MPNPFVHMELNTPDLNQAKAFYGGLFGWTFNDMNMGEQGIYSTFKTDKDPGGGMAAMPGRPSAWLSYVGVEDIDASTAKARELGAQVLQDAVEIPHVGWFSVLVDPGGATIAIFEPLPAHGQ